MAARKTRTRLAILAGAVVAATAGGLWFATGSGVDAARAPIPSAGEGSRTTAPAGAPPPAWASSDPARGEAASPAPEEGPSDVVKAEAERISDEMAKLVRDLEFTPGLREPPVQVVRPSPEPWRSDPVREGPSPEIDSVLPRRGRTAGGDQVVLRGKNLRVVEVMFGSAPGRILAATGAALTVATPPSAAGPVNIAVTNDDGTWAVAAEPFVYGD